MKVRFTAQSTGPDLTVCKGSIQTWPRTSIDRDYLHPKDKPADRVVERERRRVSHSLGFSNEQRNVELADPQRPRRDPSPGRPRRSSRFANPQDHGMMLPSKGILGFHHPKDKPADRVIEREWRHVSHGPGFSNEQRMVELTEPLRPRRDPSPRRPRRSSRSTNPQDRKMVQANKGMLGFHGCYSYPSHCSRPP